MEKKSLVSRLFLCVEFMSNKTFDLFPYTIDKFQEILSEYSKEYLVKNKTHIEYFEGYFLHQKAATIIVEYDYIDHDFLEDYASYYVRCFNRYRRYCKRIHVFDKTITKEKFENYINGRNDNFLQDAYIGFIIVKPLPKTIVGRTCLRTYDSDNDRRYYPATRTYYANLFGIELRVEDTLAFQEQDRVASACATSALWSVFQATGKKFNHPLHSPVVITESATSQVPITNRVLPNNGLTIEQMAFAIKKVGLEPLGIGCSADHPELLKANMYAYLQSGIPLIMIIDLYESNKLPDLIRHGNQRHAVAVTGFSLGNPSFKSFNSMNGILLKSSKIDKIYVHDDQVGPFASMCFEEKSVKDDGTSLNREFLSSSLKPNGGSTGDIYCMWDSLLIPLYHKIRIPFLSILTNLFYFDELIEKLRANKILNFPERLVWDVFLTTVNELKSEVRKCNVIDNKSDVLLAKLPKYIWRATLFDGDKKVMDLLFDATDIEQGSYFSRPIIYDASFGRIFGATCKIMFQNKAQLNLLDNIFVSIIEWFDK